MCTRVKNWFPTRRLLWRATIMIWVDGLWDEDNKKNTFFVCFSRYYSLQARYGVNCLYNLLVSSFSFSALASIGSYSLPIYFLCNSSLLSHFIVHWLKNVMTFYVRSCKFFTCQLKLVKHAYKMELSFAHLYILLTGVFFSTLRYKKWI